MSYILDALRRADSERERGAIPNLHAKPEALIDADDDEGGSSRPHPLLWAVIGLSVVLAGVLAWQFMGSSPAEPAPMQVSIPTPAPTPASAPAPAPVATIAPPLPQPTLPPVAMAPIQPVPQAPVQAAPRRLPARAATKASAPASAAAPERPVMTLSELPENIRRELPQITVGGAMYSENAANRMLIINGQVFHEGDKVSGELVLEQIKLKAAVLAYKGYRYGISY